MRVNRPYADFFFESGSFSESALCCVTRIPGPFLFSRFPNSKTHTHGSALNWSAAMDAILDELPDKELTAEIIGAAIAVHTALGPGFLESIYEEALCIELTLRKIPFERQRRIIVTYRDQPVGEHRLDLLVAGRVVIELKASRDLDPIHFAVVRSYMKATHVISGLLLNFAAIPLTVKRVCRELHTHADKVNEVEARAEPYLIGKTGNGDAPAFLIGKTGKQEMGTPQPF